MLGEYTNIKLARVLRYEYKNNHINDFKFYTNIIRLSNFSFIILNLLNVRYQR